MASPASSPRLPSPPPIAEDQLGPMSPVSMVPSSHFNSLEHAAARRIRPGTKAEDMAEGPPLVDLSEIDSAFQLTEHLKALHNSLTHPAGSKNTAPVEKDMAHKLAQPPENVDRTLWLYELCRFLTQKVNAIIVALFSDNPPCSSITCPEMRASEWQYLCAVHDPPKSCCAIDYCCHTLDWAANTLTSPKHFPSRLALGVDQATQHQQIRQLTNIFRRVYRIFAHAWFQHREMFWKVETQTGLYIFFKTVCDVYGLIPEDNYTIPVEAEGIEPTTEGTSSIPPLILKREPSGPGGSESESSVLGVDHNLNTAGTTKRHRHSPSVGATSVLTVMEENEEEEDPQQARAATQAESAAEESTPVDAKPSHEGEPATEEPVPAEPTEAPQAADEAEKQSASEEATEEPESVPESVPEKETEATEDKKDEEDGEDEASKATADSDPVLETTVSEEQESPVAAEEPSQDSPKEADKENEAETKEEDPDKDQDKDDNTSSVPAPTTDAAAPTEQEEKHEQLPEKAEKDEADNADPDKDTTSEDKKTGE